MVEAVPSKQHRHAANFTGTPSDRNVCVVVLGIRAAVKKPKPPPDGYPAAASFAHHKGDSECDAGHEAEDRGIFNGACSVGLNDVLDVGLKIGPLVDLQPVVDFQHTGVVRLIDVASLLQRLDVIEAVPVPSRKLPSVGRRCASGSAPYRPGLYENKTVGCYYTWGSSRTG